LAKLDGTSNEFEGLEIENLPTLFLFKGGSDDLSKRFDNKIIYEGELNPKEIYEFLKEKVFYPIDYSFEFSDPNFDNSNNFHNSTDEIQLTKHISDEL
jgi:hypothetical protein